MSGEKNLFIVRHSKSSWDYPGIADIDRNLTEKGISNAYVMAKRTLVQKKLPEAIVSSPAIRALHTAIIFSGVFDIPSGEINIEKELYLASSAEILELISGWDNSLESIMIFGHNPGFTDLANCLSTLNIENVPTTGLVQLKFKTDTWKGINKNCLSGEFIDFPQNV